jgi:hypothetical protein
VALVPVPLKTSNHPLSLSTDRTINTPARKSWLRTPRHGACDVLALKPLDVRFVVIALAVGFPIAMLLAWVYEFTPEGIVRTEDLQPAQARSSQRATGRILDFILVPLNVFQQRLGDRT